MRDKHTYEYFNNYTPHYNPERFEFAFDYLNDEVRDGQNILDIGCGDGATLNMIKARTPLQNLCGLDISENYAEKTRQAVGCAAIVGNILDDDLVYNHRGQFDYCTLGSVLHHLIGKNRRESASLARTCVKNAIDLLKPEGSLMIFEPAHSPLLLMNLVFWIKKIVGNFTNERIELTRQWMNFGQPVVSYYTPKQLRSFIDSVNGATVLSSTEVEVIRMGMVIKRVCLGIIVKKNAE